jgi:biotin transport system substrate-specific component
MASLPSTPPFVTVAWPVRTRGAQLVRNLSLVVVGSLLLTLSAKTQVPFYPVPMTLQTAVVFLLGIAYGWRLAVGTVLFYLAQGAIGLPVLAGTPQLGVGLAYMTGPTGGYLMGFVVAAAITGLPVFRAQGMIVTAVGVAAATAAVYLLGAGWLGTLTGPAKAITVGVKPFLLGDLFKLLLVTALTEVGHDLIRRRLDAKR